MKIFLLIAIIGDASNYTHFLKKQCFFNSATVLLDFFINQASNVVQVFLSTFNPYHTDILYLVYLCPCLQSWA